MAKDIVTPASSGRLQWIFILLLFVVAGALGLAGYSQLSPTAHPFGSVAWWQAVSDNAFSTIMLYTFSAPYNESGGNLTLHLARLLAPLATLSALTKIMVQAVYSQAIHAQIRRQRGHVVIVGFGRIGQQLARQLLATGAKVTALDPRPTREAQDLSSRMNVPLVAGDGTLKEDLAAVGCARARHIFFVTDADVVNVESAIVAGDLIDPNDGWKTNLNIHLNSLQFSHQLEEYERQMALIGEGETSVTIFSLDDLLAIQLLYDNPLYRIAHWLSHERIHVLLIGANDVCERIISNTLLYQRTPSLGKPRITVVDENATEMLRRMRSRYPGLAMICDIEAVDESSETAEWISLTEHCNRASPLTATVLCRSNDIPNLTAGLELHSLSGRQQLHCGQIFVRRNHESEFLAKLSSTKEMDLSNHLSDFSAAGENVLVTKIMGDDDTLARRIHASYARESMAKGEVTPDWDQLVESHRRSNRRASEHIWTKLASAGYRLSQDHSGLPQLADGGLALEEEGFVKAIARLEHERWIADRVLDGWRYAPLRDNYSRHHPMLKPYDDLPDSEKQKDADQVAFLKEILESQETSDRQKLYLECIVGILFDDRGSGPPSANATSLADGLLNDYSGQSYTIVCKARSEEELSWLRTFRDHLADRSPNLDWIHVHDTRFEERDLTLDTPHPGAPVVWVNLAATGTQVANGKPIGLDYPDYLGRVCTTVLSPGS